MGRSVQYLRKEMLKVMKVSTGLNSIFLEAENDLEHKMIMPLVGHTCVVLKDNDSRIEIIDLRPTDTEDRLSMILNLQHDNMLVTAPWNMFLGGKKPLEIKLVTSSKTERTYETGKEDDVLLIK